MKHMRLVSVFAFLLVSGLFSYAQTAAANQQQFDRDGITFSYPSGWALQDMSSPNSNEYVFGRADLDVQLKVFVFRTRLDSPEKLAEAKKILVDQYIQTTTKSLIAEGAKPTPSASSTEIAGVHAEGIKLKASFDGVPGAAEIDWAVVEDKMIVLTFFGPDKEYPKALPAWDMIRTTIKIAPAPKPAPVPAASPTPKKPAN